MNDVATLDENYSTLQGLIKSDPLVIADQLKQSYKSKGQFEMVLILPEGEGRQGAGGLRTQGYFKVGGLISEIDQNHSEKNEESTHVELSIQNSKLEKKPLITVVTVVFNGEKFLEETILSVINQTYDNLEYIIIDGGSTDGTLAIIKKYEHAIDYWVSEKDKGIYDAMNKGIALATGQWINFMNAGDLFSSNSCVSGVLKSFKDDLMVVFGKSLTVFKNKSVLRYRNFNSKDKAFFKNRMPNHQAVFFNYLFYKNESYDLSFSIASDTDYLNRAFSTAMYEESDIIISKFYLGGVSSYYKSIAVAKMNCNDAIRLGANKKMAFIKTLIKFIFMKTLKQNIYFYIYFGFIKLRNK